MLDFIERAMDEGIIGGIWWWIRFGCEREEDVTVDLCNASIGNWMNDGATV